MWDLTSVLDYRAIFPGASCPIMSNLRLEETMARDRFTTILRGWHCSDNAQDFHTDPYFKIRVPMDTLNNNLTRLTEISLDCNTDESTWNAWTRTKLVKNTEGKKSTKGFQ